MTEAFTKAGSDQTGVNRGKFLGVLRMEKAVMIEELFRFTLSHIMIYSCQECVLSMVSAMISAELPFGEDRDVLKVSWAAHSKHP